MTQDAVKIRCGMTVYFKKGKYPILIKNKL